MIQIVKKTTVPIPIMLQNKGTVAANALIARYENGDRNFSSKDFDKDIYGHSEVKIALQSAQNDKCCFCESKISHISSGDVEHYRPKTAWVQEEEALNRPGYYWLSYNWDNLLLSCEKCNRRYKKNHFPLRDHTTRALSHAHDLNTEEPLFIHPVLDNPEDYITFRDEIPVAINSNDRGTTTISQLGLDREPLNEQRRGTLNKIRQIYLLAKGIPDTNTELKQQAKGFITGCYEESLSDETEYAAMRRAFFRDNPIDF